jgi:hypothetical protein
MATQIPLTPHRPSISLDIEALSSPQIITPNDSENHISASSQLRPITRNRQILVLISSFLTICITIGFNQAYGVFQSYYISSTQTMLPKSTSSDSALVAFVGTLGYGLTWGGSIVVNPITARLDVRGNRALGVLGILLMSAGFGLASLSTQVSCFHSSFIQNIEFLKSGLAPPPHSRPSLRHRLLIAVFPHLERSTRIFHRSPRVRNGFHPLRRRNRWSGLLTYDPSTSVIHWATLDAASSLLYESACFSPHCSHCISITLHRTPTYACGF